MVFKFCTLDSARAVYRKVLDGEWRVTFLVNACSLKMCGFNIYEIIGLNSNELLLIF